jgi:DNA replication protein DnaC
MGEPVRLAGPLAEVIRAAQEAMGEHEDQVRADLERDSRERRAERIVAHAKLVTSEDFRRIVRDDLAETPALGWVKRFLASSSPRARFLWLAGTTGVGKTVACLWALAGRPGRLVTADQVRRAYGQEHDEARAIRNYVEDCGLLVIDDVGTARDESEGRALFELVNARQGGRRKTLITGNLDRATIASRYDQRLLARVQHSGGIVDCGSNDLRRRV